MLHKTALLLTLTSLGLPHGCSSSSEPPPEIRSGTGIGKITVGMRYDEVSALYGELDNAIVDGRIAVGGYPEEGLDLILTSAEDTRLSPDAVVIAVGAKTEAFGGFPRPGLDREVIEAELGEPPLKAGPIVCYTSGVSVKYDAADKAKAVGVFEPFERAPEPPAMEPAETSAGGV